MRPEALRDSLSTLSMSSMEQAGAATASLLGVSVLEVHSLGGAAFQVQLESGKRVVAKHHIEPTAVRAEAASLEWLAEAEAVSVPRLRAEGEQWLITDYVPGDSPHQDAAGSFGRALARLHSAGAPAHGATPPGGPADASIGLAPMRNCACTTWPGFYGPYRVDPYLRKAVDRGIISRSDGQVVSKVVDRLEELAGPAEPPSRLHGDLWNGNVLWSTDGAWLIDPAAHGGHRETDLAMLRLFGCPHLDQIIDAYHQQMPLADGWQTRVSLHQLFPLLVHTVLFGGSYGHQAVSAARKALQGG